MLGMALVIQFVVGASDPAFWQVEHYYWMLLLALLVCKGAGVVSLDRQWLTRRLGIAT
jgi:putative oxidoreductase